MWATAYCPNCRVCETDWVTATGTNARRPGVAVASRRWRRVMPLGSRIYLPGRGWVRVDDTGGKVRSNQIDIRVPSHRQAVRWGRRKLKVRWLPPARRA